MTIPFSDFENLQMFYFQKFLAKRAKSFPDFRLDCLKELKKINSFPITTIEDLLEYSLETSNQILLLTVEEVELEEIKEEGVGVKVPAITTTLIKASNKSFTDRFGPKTYFIEPNLSTKVSPVDDDPSEYTYYDIGLVRKGVSYNTQTRSKFSYFFNTILDDYLYYEENQSINILVLDNLSTPEKSVFCREYFEKNLTEYLKQADFGLRDLYINKINSLIYFSDFPSIPLDSVENATFLDKVLSSSSTWEEGFNTPIIKFYGLIRKILN